MKTSKFLMMALLATTLPLAAAMAAGDEGTSVNVTTKADAGIVKQQNRNSTDNGANHNRGKSPVAAATDTSVNTNVTASDRASLNSDWFGKGGYEADKSGIVTRTSYETRFRGFDTDNDGIISTGERQASGASDSWYKQAALDTNNDGKISRAEYNARFSAFDTNGDGRISVSERAATRLNSTEPASK